MSIDYIPYTLNISLFYIFLVLTGSGELEFEEFCTLAARFLVEEDTEAMQQELREAFRLYDKEGNGYITTEVFRDILHELDDKLSPEELDLMIEEIDADGSGTLDFDGIFIITYIYIYNIYIFFYHFAVLVTDLKNQKAIV